MVRLLPRIFSRADRRDWRGLSGGPQAKLIPHSRLSGPMPWVIAVMVALTVVAAAAGLAMRNTTRSAADELAGGITVQVVEANPAERERQARAAARRLKETPGVIDAHVVSSDEIERLIEPWLGEHGGQLADDAVPVPALIDARLRDPVDSETLGALRSLVREVAPAARVDAQSSWLAPVYGAIESLQWLAIGLVGLLGFAFAASVVLAVRNALGVNRETIEIVHMLGGTDRQIARIFQRSVGYDAAGGGAMGLAYGLLAVQALGSRFAGLGAGLVSRGALGLYDWIVLGLIPVAGVVLAVLAARLTVLGALKKML